MGEVPPSSVPFCPPIFLHAGTVNEGSFSLLFTLLPLIFLREGTIIEEKFHLPLSPSAPYFSA